MHHGFTLLELAVVLTLLALIASLSVPMSQRARDRLAVIGAREEIVGLITRARAEALRRGGSSLTVIKAPAEIRIETAEELLHRVDMRAIWRTELTFSGGRPSIELRFDASGLGNMAARSITLTRGTAVVRLIVSAYGRIRRE